MVAWLGSSASECAGIDLIGGYANINPGESFTRLYANAPLHNSLEITFTLFAIDNWEAADQIDIEIDGVNIPFTGLNATIFPVNLCGGAEKDMTTTIYFTVAHT